MNAVFQVALLSVVACAMCSPASVDEGMLAYAKTVHKLKTAVRTSGCEINVCFTFDTSGSVSRRDFQLQKDFILDITSIIGTDPRARFAASQYGRRTYRISNLTPSGSENAVSDFNQAVSRAEFKHDSATSIGSGIVWCDRQLRRQRGDTNKMVVMGDGRNNLGGSPVTRANTFRERTDNGVVSAVGIGFRDESVLNRIAGDRGSVFAIQDYVELSFLVEDLVADICKLPLQ